MKTPIVHETRRAGQPQAFQRDPHTPVVVGAMIAMPPLRATPSDEASSEQRRAA